jgi:lipopolysaccharide transport system ATP-binding protein
MYVRLAFAVAAHLEPEILIVDEVLAVGDAEFQKKCLGKMGDVAHQGRTVLFVSHNMGAVAELCPSSMLLIKGKKKSLGNSNEIINEYTKTFLSNHLIHERNLQNVQEGRVWKGPAKFSYFSIYNTEKELCSKFANDETIIFLTSITGIINQTYKLEAEIRNQSGQLIYHIVSSDDNFPIKLEVDEISIEIKMKKNNLKDGTYYITLRLLDTLNQLNDQIENVLPFEIFTQHKKNTYTQGLVVQSCEWKRVTRY